MNWIISALAAYYCWTCIRFLLPLVLPDRAALVLMGAAAYGIIVMPWDRARTALAVAGAVVLLVSISSRWLGVDPEPWHLPRLRLPRISMPRAPRRAQSRVGSRIPRI